VAHPLKDAIWTSTNLLVRKHMLIPPVAVIRIATVKVAVAAGGRPRTQRRLASVPIRTWEPEPHEERSRQHLALRVRLVGRSRGARVSAEQPVPRGQCCWREREGDLLFLIRTCPIPAQRSFNHFKSSDNFF